MPRQNPSDHNPPDEPRSAILLRTELRDCAPDTPPTAILHLTIAEGTFDFSAGQYLEVLHPKGESIPLSIASPAFELPKFRLHYRSMPGAPGAAAMDDLLSAIGDGSGKLTIRGPAGSVRVDAEETRRVLLIAGGFVVVGELLTPLLVGPLLMGVLQQLAIQSPLREGVAVGSDALLVEQDEFLRDLAHFGLDAALGLGEVRTAELVQRR